MALQRFQRCRELTSTLPYFSLHENPFAIAYLMKRRYEETIEVSRRVVQNSPTYVNGYKPLIAALGHLGRRKEALGQIRALLSIEPAFTVDRFEQTYPFTQRADLEHYAEGLRRAGAPKF
jgi:adenylate cyclase